MVSRIFGEKDSPSCTNYCLKITTDDNKNIFTEEAVKSVQEEPDENWSEAEIGKVSHKDPEVRDEG